MKNYAQIVAVLNFLIDFLLVLGTNRLCGCPPRPGKAVLAAAAGGIYSGACLLPGFGFLGNILWRLVSLATIGWIAFGWDRSGVRRTAVFGIICMAVGGAAAGLGGNAWSLLGAAVCVFVLCLVGFRNHPPGAAYVPVELSYGEKKLQLTALRDTGNTLRDPLTGGSVLVIGADAARELTGLTRQQLADPIASMASGILPGLRLIPYRSVGQPAGMLLALRFPKVRIGAWHGSGLVAFAPEGLGTDGNYQALTGGTV